MPQPRKEGQKPCLICPNIITRKLRDSTACWEKQKYCSYACRAAAQITVVVSESKPCEYCNAPIYSAGFKPANWQRTKYCSKACYGASLIKVRDPNPKVCEYCCVSFYQNKRSTYRWTVGRFCSQACARSSHNDSRKNRWINPSEFWNSLDMKSKPGCWLWTGRTNKAGYGTIGINGKQALTHRHAHIVSIGPIPRGLGALHHCDTPACCRPKHLYAGTQQQNIQDMMNRNRHYLQRRKVSCRS